MLGICMGANEGMKVVEHVVGGVRSAPLKQKGVWAEIKRTIMGNGGEHTQAWTR